MDTADLKSTALWAVGRTAGMYGALKIVGQNDQALKRAIVGAIAVQLFVSLWNLFSAKAVIPSDVAVQTKDPIAILATATARAVLIGGGMYASGFRTNLVRDAIACTAVIELGVIASNLYPNLITQGGS